MPKETIRDDTGTYHVEVSWLKDTWVSLATVTADGQSLKERVKEFEDGETPRGLYVSLTRESINQMIRVLRRARDQVFGRDE
jgi:hypothetical protein